MELLLTLGTSLLMELRRKLDPPEKLAARVGDRFGGINSNPSGISYSGPKIGDILYSVGNSMKWVGGRKTFW